MRACNGSMHIDPTFCPDCRYLPSTNVAIVRQGLKQLGLRYDTVRFECFNKTEADEVAALLTPAERAKVLFTWLFQ